MTNATKSHLSRAEWQALIEVSSNQLSPEERSIAVMLAQGKTQAAVAVQLGLHRSAVWRRAKAMAKRQPGTGS